jgi:replicative DNA helicase
LADDVVELVRSLGGRCSVSTKQTTYTHLGERRNGLPAHVCNIQHVNPGELFLLSDKRSRLPQKWHRQKRLTIESIEPTRVAPAQCISVTHPDRLYITDDYIVTHNTALATNIAFNAAKALKYEVGPTGEKKVTDGAIVAFFSLEMSAEQLAGRILADRASINSHKIRQGELSNEEFGRLVLASQELHSLPLYIDDTPALSVSAVRTRCRRLARTQGLGMIVIDYLQLLSATAGKRVENRVQEVSDITRQLKALAKELNVPVLALSQLSRAVEQREDKRPQLADLRESGSIEQDADVVMFVYREQYYLERAEPGRRPEEAEDKFNARYEDWHKRLQEVTNTAEAIIAKQRHGPVGSVRLFFDGQFTRFADLDNWHGTEREYE